MGHLVRLQFEYDDPRKVKLLVCSLPHFSEYDPETREFYYRSNQEKLRQDDMPDAFIRIQDDGLDFCAYGSPAVVGEIYHFLKKRIALEFGQCTEQL